MNLPRRGALGVVGVLAAAATGLVELARGLGSPAPRPRVVPGTTRLLESYGSGARRRGEWWVPPGTTGLLPTVVLVHGGYWRSSYDLHLEDAVAADLAGRGYLVWNIDYAPSAEPWPATLTDAAAAYDFLSAGRYAGRVDAARVAVVGHSAGGHLALWLGSRTRVPSGGPGAGSFRRPALLVPQAPVASLARGSREGLGSGAVDALVGGSPAQQPKRYREADPIALLPTGIRTVLLHGQADAIVPISQSEDYLAATGPTTCSLVRVRGDHFAHLDPSSPAVEALRAALASL